MESDDAQWLVFSAAKTAWYCLTRHLHFRQCIKHLRWRTSSTLQTAKPVIILNFQETVIIHQADCTYETSVLWCFQLLCCVGILLVVNVFFWLLHRPTLLKGLWSICYDKLHILLFCDYACDICCIYHLEGLSNVYCCCYAQSIQNTHFAPHI